MLPDPAPLDAGGDDQQDQSVDDPSAEARDRSLPARRPPVVARVGAEAPLDLVRAFRHDLAAGRYYPRERLIEADLAVRYGTTRAAIREALIQLIAEGFVETEPNRGARVRPMSIAEAIEIAEVRRALETLCARRAAELATDVERAEIVDVAARLRVAATSGHVGEYLDENTRFHTLIYWMSHHATARHILEYIQHRPIDRLIPGVFRNRPPTASVRAHEDIAEAIAAGDPERAGTRTFEHLTNLIEALREYESIVA